MDIKNQLIAVFEAVEQLIKNNYQPERTVMLSFSHNEEVLGSGAVAVVAHLKAKGIHVQSVIDEGGSIYDDMIPGVEGLAAMIGVAEKGYLSLKLQAQASGGHSSTPSKLQLLASWHPPLTACRSTNSPLASALSCPCLKD